MASLVDLHEAEVTSALDIAILLVSLVRSDLEALCLGLGEVLLARPLKSIGPSLVTEPVADKVGVTSIDENGNLLQKLGHKLVIGLHPVTLHQEVTVDVKVAAVVSANFNAKSLHDFGLVEPLGNVTKSRVAEVAAILTVAADIVDIATSALVWAHDGIVAVKTGRHAAPYALAVIAALNERLATGQSTVHGTASGFVNNSGITTLAAGHGTVVLVLGKGISQAVANQNALEVDIAILVGQNLR